MADQGGGVSGLMRDYRKGNWTVSETMILIEAKRMDDERRMKRSSESEGRGKPAELRWKWVEDYCWRKGCLRSQNQCNDKWDNLMRDYKKVRDYERRLAEKRGEGSSSSGNGDGSYWKLQKNERKERNLPSNMLDQIYDALVEVVEKRGEGSGLLAHQRVLVGGGSGNSTPSNPNLIIYGMERLINSAVQVSLPPLLQHQVSVPTPTPVLTLPAPAPPPPPLPTQPSHGQVPPAIPCSQPLPSEDSDNTSDEYSDSPAKRRRRGGGGGGGGGGEGTSSGGNASGSTSHEVGNAISRSASIIAETIQACEEREERRHRDLMTLHEKRLRIEESKIEISRQGINGLVEAINNLANSIHALSSHKSQSPPK